MQIYITFGLYLLVILGIGLYAYRSTQNFDDYILGGRKMGSFLTSRTYLLVHQICPAGY